METGVHISVFKRNNIPQLTRCTMCCKRYHCPLCPTVMYKSRCKAKVLQHMEVHLKNALQHEDFYITKCHRECRSGASGHFHCPFCFKTTIRRQDSIRHLEICRPPYHDGHQQLQGVATYTEEQSIISQTVASVPCLTEREERQSQQQESRADSMLLPHFSWHDNDQLPVVLPSTSPPSSVGTTSTPTKTTEKRLFLTPIQKRNLAAHFQVVLRSPQQPVPHPRVTPSTSGTYLAFPVGGLIQRYEQATLPTSRHSKNAALPEDPSVPNARLRDSAIPSELSIKEENAEDEVLNDQENCIYHKRPTQSSTPSTRLLSLQPQASPIVESDSEHERYEKDPSVSTSRKQGTMRPAPPALSTIATESPSDCLNKLRKEPDEAKTRTCSVVGCESGRCGAQRYKLPEDPDMRLKWVQFLFEVNGQQLKESSWTDISICSEHFTIDCYDNQTGQLKVDAVPSLCIKSEPEGLLKSPHVVDSTASLSDGLDTRSPPSFSPEQSRAASTDLESSGVSNAATSESNPMQQKVMTDMKRENDELLQIDKTFLLNEHGLLKLFVHKCPSCDYKLQLEQVAHDALIVVNQQCHRCDYRFQWKSQVSAGVPTVEHRTEDSEETPEGQQATPVEVSRYCTEVITVLDEEAAATDESEELTAPDGGDTDEEWTPSNWDLLVNIAQAENEENTGSDSEENDDDCPPGDPMDNELCTDCGTFFSKQRRHTCEHKIKPFSCNICGKRCVSMQALKSHSRIHNVNYEFRCKYCSVTFKTKADKMTHEVIHATEGKPYRCPDCSETFASNKERSTHLEVHRGPRQLTCDICGMDFLSPGYLDRHMAVHTGLKAFKCVICNRAFKQPSHLKSHMRLHTGERPYKCQYCDKCFNHNVSLKSHIQRYHPSNSEEKSSDAENNTIDIIEEEQCKPSVRRKKTGRPKGRPKNSEFGNSTEGHSSNGKTRKPQRIKSKRRHSRNEESEDTSDGSSSGSEVERGRKRTKITARSRGQPENVDSDLDFNPAEVKKQRHSSQNGGDSSPKRRGRPRKKV